MIKPDPIYEEIIDDLINAGKIMSKCRHKRDVMYGGPCPLCTGTWDGVVDNVTKIRSGLTKIKKGGKK